MTKLKEIIYDIDIVKEAIRHGDTFDAINMLDDIIRDLKVIDVFES